MKEKISVTVTLEKQNKDKRSGSHFIFQLLLCGFYKNK